MVKKKKDMKTVKIKKKIWLDLVAPSMFNNIVLGQTNVEEKASALNKTMSINLMAVVGDPRKQSHEIKFVVKKIIGEKAFTEFIGYKMLPSGIKRMVRRDRDKIDDSFICRTQDNIQIRVKSLIITRTKAKSSAINSIKKIAIEHIVRVISKNSFESLAKEIISGKLQMALKDMLKKIHPVVFCEIRDFHIIKWNVSPKTDLKEVPKVESKPQLKVEQKTEHKDNPKKEAEEDSEENQD